AARKAPSALKAAGFLAYVRGLVEMPVWRSASSHAWRMSSSTISRIGRGSILAMGSSWLKRWDSRRREGAHGLTGALVDSIIAVVVAAIGNGLHVGGGLLRQPSRSTDTV